MVVVKALSIVMLAATERCIVVNAFLFLCGFTGGIDHAEGKAHEQRPDLHPMRESKRDIKNILEEVSTSKPVNSSQAASAFAAH